MNVFRTACKLLAMAVLAIAPLGWIDGALGQSLRKVRIVFAQPLPLPAYSFLYVGRHLGTFTEEGLDVDITWAASSTVGIQQLVGGNADVFVGAFDSILASLARGQDLGLQAFYSYQRGNQVSLVVGADSPVKRARDLQGKTVGVQTLASANIINTVKAALRSDGIDPASVELVVVGVGLQAATALNSGRVAAIAQVDTSVAQIENLGHKVRRLPNSPDAATISAMMTARRDFIEKNPDLITRLTRAIIKGNIFFVENPEAAVRIAYALYPEVKPKDLPEDEAIRQGVRLIEARARNQDLPGGDVPMWGAVSDREWKTYLTFLDVDPAKVPPREQLLTDRFLKDANAFDQDAYRRWARSYRFQAK